MNVAIIVPARIGSTRFPKKLLHKIKDKPVIVWTADRIKKEAPEFPLFFAVDHESLADVLRRDGYDVIMTDQSHTCGTDRITFTYAPATAASGLNDDRRIIASSVPNTMPPVTASAVSVSVNVIPSRKR